MDPPERQGSQQKKSRKPLPTSRKSTGAPATASARANVPPSGLRASSGTFAGGSGVAAPSLGCGTGSHHVASAFWEGMSPGGSFTPDSNPSSSEWLYPPGGFVNSLQMPYPYVNYPNASQLQENSHFVGCPSTRGTPSPNGSSLAKDGLEAHETIDIDGDETLEPARTDKRLNWSHEEDVRLHIWRVVRHERKWAAYVKKLNKEKDNPATPANVVSVEDFSPKERPVGHKKAKDERSGKRKAPEAISAIGEKLDKFIEASTKAEKMTEAQQSLANKKLEVAKLNHKAAQEQTKAKMLDKRFTVWFHK